MVENGLFAWALALLLLLLSSVVYPSLSRPDAGLRTGDSPAGPTAPALHRPLHRGMIVIR